MKINAITRGLANSRKYNSTRTAAAMIGSDKRSFVFGFNRVGAA